MAGYIGKTTNLDREVVGTQTQGEREDVMGEIPGKIISFDPATQTATIQPAYKPKHNGKPVDMPELLEVPVRFPRAGKGGITYPIAAGDMVTLRPQMRSSEKYHTEGTYEATDTRSMNLSDMEAFVDGGESLQDPIKNFDPANVHIRGDEDGEFGIRISKEGKLKIEGNQGNIYILYRDGLNLAKQIAYFLKDEPALINGPAYAAIETSLAEIVAKLDTMAL